MKNCTRCGHIKDVSEFSADKQKKDGLRNWCRVCVRDHRRINADSIKESKARYAAENRDVIRQRNREYREANRDVLLERQRAYDADNRDKIAARTAAYYAQYPEKKWINTYQNRAKRLGITPVVEEFTKNDVILAYGDSCHYCSESAFEELDHHIPVAAGGAHTLANVRPSCTGCNNKKSQSDRVLVNALRSAEAG